MEGAPYGVRRAPVAFLDANVLFSACLGGGSFELLIRLGREGAVRLVTSSICEREARANLARKYPDKVADLDPLLRVVNVLDPAAAEHRAWAAACVHTGDVHVLAAARAVGADVLVTGDRAHFGHLMDLPIGSDEVPIRVRTVRAFLEEGPRPGPAS
jgi:predicted nucleic acid-binding protein